MPDNWQDMSSTPDKPMPVIYFSRDMMFFSLATMPPTEITPDDARGERLDIGYWDGEEFYYSGSNHAVFEWPDDADSPSKPTHWRPITLPSPPTDKEPS